MALQLSVALVPGRLTRPILSGEVQVDGASLHPIGLHPSELFWRQLRFQEFDVSELSLASLAIQVARGARDWVALPVFTTRRFFHTEILVRSEAGIDSPADLKGKRVAVSEYQQTAAVWARGALVDEFGVQPEHIDWFMARGRSNSHAAAAGASAPPGIRLTTIPETSSVASMLQSGELDAVLHYVTGNNVVDKSAPDVRSLANVRLLFRDPVAEGVRYHNATGLLPMNHCVVVRRSLVEEHPWLVLNLYSAFTQAKHQADAVAADVLAAYERVGALARTSVDPLPYGLQAQQGVAVDTLLRYLHEQGLTQSPVKVADLFAAQVLGL